MRRLRSVALLAMLLTACGDSFSPDGVSGLYTLVRIDATCMPVSETTTINQVSTVREIPAGSVTLNAGGTFTVSITTSVTSGGTTVTDTEETSGTFTLEEPSTIRFVDSGGSTFSGTLQDATEFCLVLEDDSEQSTIVFDGQPFSGQPGTIIDAGEDVVFRK